MKVKCHQRSSVGAVREHNEDFIAFWEPEDFFVRQKAGSVAILADGVGGQDNGEIASRMAAETALEIFQGAKTETPVTDLVREIYDEAAMKVFQAAQQTGRMATTL